MALTNYPNGLSSFGVPVLPGIPVPFTGKYYFVDPVNGSDGYKGVSINRPFQTIYKALSVARSGYNDTIFLIGNGAASGTARLSLANAQSVDSTVTAGTLVWNKDAVHLIGISSPSNNSRARLAPPTGTYTQATFGSGNFVVVSGSGCFFSNISIFNGFSTGGTNQIAWTDNGQRNVYNNVEFLGLNDAASAANTGSRSLKIGSGGSGEHVFNNCIIGGDTTTRSVANASLELAGATPRNTFNNCIFPFQTSNAGVLGILATGAGAVDRWNLFNRCSFINNIASTSTQMTVLASLTNAAPGGLLEFKDCTLIGITKFGDTNALANSYIDGAAPTAATSGLAVNPA